MNPIEVTLLVLVAIAAGAAAAVVLTTRRTDHAGAQLGSAVQESVVAAVSAAVADTRAQASTERDAAVRAALQQGAVLNREQLASGLSAGSAEVGQVRDEMRAELQRLGGLVEQLGRRSSEQFGRVESTMRAHGEITQMLSTSTSALKEALASTKVRGQWGERMAEDVLRLAGFQENVNYVKQTAIAGARAMPDFTFTMPKGHVLYMDVKFPLSAYVRFLEAQTEAERSAHRATFVRDVRLRIKELADRDYQTIGNKPAVDYVLLFLPNETISAFIHESDADLIEHALGRKVVLCSPLTLFAFLGVIHQAFDNFVVERTSDEILKLLGAFGLQWNKYTESLDKVHTKFESVQKEFEQLNGARRRQLEKPLRQLEDLRHTRGLPVDGELFNVYELGA
jgi:DNA recombination protein RmuC